jgi:integrase
MKMEVQPDLIRKNLKRTPIFKYAKERVTVMAFLDTKNMKENQKFPVRICVTYDCKQIYYSPGIDLTQDEYTELSSNRSRAVKIRGDIKKHFDIVEGHVSDLLDSPYGFSLPDLNKRLSKGRKNSIEDAFGAKVKELKQNSKLGTADWYDYTLKSIQKFTSQDLKFSDINVKWLRKYESWLIEKEKSFTTISMYMRALQAILKQAQRENIITASQWPFGRDKDGRYQIPESEGRKSALTLQQIGAVIKYPAVSPVMDRCRDLWLFSYMCNGINMNDLLRLKFSNIIDDEISYYRRKTLKTKKKQKPIDVTLLPEMSAIIEKWGNTDQDPDNYIFPFISKDMTIEDERRIIKNVTRLINKKMGDIGKKLGYGNISTYSARHSFATVLKRSGANIAFISESLGHADLKTTENYLANFEKEERVKNAQKLRPEYPVQLKIAK